MVDEKSGCQSRRGLRFSGGHCGMDLNNWTRLEAG